MCAKTLLIALSLCTSSIAASFESDRAHSYCLDNGGKVEIKRTDRGDLYRVCSFGGLVDCAVGGGVCFRYGECEVEGFLAGTCFKYDCHQIKVSYDAQDSIVIECH